jgi:predicted ATPase
VAELLSIPTVGRYKALDLSPQKHRRRTLATLLAQVEGLAARQPALVVFEDVHWIDPTSLEALDLLVDRAPSLALLLIITFRPEFLPPWIGRSQVSVLTLNRLARQESAEMVVGVAGAKVLPKEIAARIVERSDGIPLFVEELTKAVLESDVSDAGGQSYKPTESVPSLTVPTTLYASLLADHPRPRGSGACASCATTARRDSH